MTADDLGAILLSLTLVAVAARYAVSLTADMAALIERRSRQPVQTKAATSAQTQRM